MGVVRPVGGVTVNGIVMIYVMSTERAWVVFFICCCFCLLFFGIFDQRQSPTVRSSVI